MITNTMLGELAGTYALRRRRERTGFSGLGQITGAIAVTLPSGNSVTLPEGFTDWTPEQQSAWIQQSPLPAAIAIELEEFLGLSQAAPAPTPSPTPTPTPTPTPHGTLTNYTPITQAQYNATPTDSDQQFIVSLYKKYMGRAPDQAGFNFWLSNLAGSNRAAVEAAFSQSDEAKAYSKHWYSQVATAALIGGAVLVGAMALKGR